MLYLHTKHFKTVYILHVEAAVAQPPGKPDVALLPPPLPPAVPYQPELPHVGVLAVPQGRH